MRKYAPLVCLVLIVASLCFADNFRASPDVRDTTSCAYVTNPLVLGASSWRQHKRRLEQNAEKIISTTRDGVTVELRRDDDSLALTVVDSTTGAFVGTLRCKERAVGALIDVLKAYYDEEPKTAK